MKTRLALLEDTSTSNGGHVLRWEAFLDSESLGEAGLTFPAWAGVAEAWVTLTDLGRAHPIIVHRLVIRTLGEQIAVRKLHRVSADVVREHTIARAWIERLGFHPEGLMLHAGPNGSDLVRYRLL